MKVILILFGMAGLLLVAAVWPYVLVVSPKATLRIVDDRETALRGIKVIRECSSSEGYRSREEGVTDTSGEVSFSRIDTHISQLRHLLKPLLVFIPANCGPGWEIWGEAEYRIFWPSGCNIRLDEKQWRKFYGTYENRDGIHIGDPWAKPRPEYLRLYTLRKIDDFSFTLQFLRNAPDPTQ